MTRRLLGPSLFLLLAAAPVRGMASAPPPAEWSEPDEAGSRQKDLYDQGSDALEEGQWDRAVATFSEAARGTGDRADGALYWKAYAQNKLGRRAEGLATLAELEKRFPRSRWKNDARALEVELRGGRSVRPDAEGDEDLKLIALNSLMYTDADRAIPLLEKFLHGNQPPKLKDRALFVLAQHGSPRAREIVADTARGKSNPDLQVKAIHYLGVFGGREARQVLSDIYASAPNVEIKKKVLHSFMVSGDRDRILSAARSEKNVELRSDAIHWLGVMGANSEIWQMYQSEASVDVKEAVIQAMFLGGDAEHLQELARSEKVSDLREQAIHRLGLIGKERTGSTLIGLYRSEREPDVRRAVLQALFLQQNSRALIDIARSEKDRSLKEEAVNKLSIMNNKEANDYLLEILNH